MPSISTQRNYRTTTQSVPPAVQPGRKKVAFVCNDTKTLYFFRKEAILELVKNNYSVYIIAPFDEFTQFFLANGVQVHDLKLNRQGRNILEDYKSHRNLYNAYKKVSPDILFQYTIKINIYGSISAKKLKIPCVSVVPGLGHYPDTKNKALLYLLNKGYKNAAKCSAEIWFLNSHDHGYFEANGWLNQAQCRILPGEGINREIFSYKPPIAKKKLQALFLGRFLISKGARTFAKTAELSRKLGLNISFKMVGFIDESHADGISSNELNEWIRKGWVVYGGATDFPQDELEKSDIILVPTNYREGLNRVIQEALAIGRPVITTSVPGAGELIEHNKTGYIVPPNDPAAIVEVLQLFLSISEEQKRKTAIEGSKYITNKYNVNKVLPHYWDAIYRLCT